MQANQLFLKRSGVPGAGAGGNTSADKCDGQDELGCYQVSTFSAMKKFLISVLGWHCDRCNFGGIYTHTCGLNLPQINDSDSRNEIKESLLCLKNTVFENPLNIDQKVI